MSALATIEIKAFVPARDLALSIRFFTDFGFELGWQSDEMAYLKVGASSFLLQKFYLKEHAENFMMHILVPDLDPWWERVVQQDLAGRYGVRVVAPQDQPWGMRDFVVIDPTGVLWRVGQDTEAPAAASGSADG